MTGAVDVDGNASLASSGVSTSVVTVSTTNAAPNGAHPWHLYQGQCGDNSAIALPRSGSYYVAVNASEANMRIVVACGNLAMPNAT